jgi:outer membrane protein OmpA-like peptidoglycan-associated protein
VGSGTVVTSGLRAAAQAIGDCPAGAQPVALLVTDGLATPDDIDDGLDAPSPATTPPAPAPLVIEDVAFATGSAVLLPDARDRINDAAADLLRANPTAVRIDGYADDRGTPEANRELSEQRAIAVADALVGAAPGLAAALGTISGHGETGVPDPACSGDCPRTGWWSSP